MFLKNISLLQGVPKSGFQNAAEAQESYPLLSAAAPFFPTHMTHERWILDPWS